MNTSDIIAIVAIIASAIVSIISAITSYKNTKLSIEARRSEMAFEKQIEAFRELAEKLGGIRKSFVMFSTPVSEREQETFFARIEKAVLDYHFTYQKFRVYLPSDLDSVLREFTPEAVSYYADADYGKHMEFLEKFNKIETKIIKIMNKYMGIN